MNSRTSTAVGISIQSSNVTIKNGSIAGFYNSILAGGSGLLTGIDLEQIVFSGAGSYSVTFDAVNNSVIRDCNFTQAATSPGAYAINDTASQTGNNFINDLMNNYAPLNLHSAYPVTFVLNMTVRK